MDKAFFIFSEASRQSHDVDEWLSGDPPEFYAIARKWFQNFRNCGEDVNALIHDGCPTACVNDTAFAYVNVHKTHIGIGFYMGAYLPDPQKLLEGSGKRMRHVKIHHGKNVNENALIQLVSDAYEDMKQRMHKQ